MLFFSGSVTRKFLLFFFPAAKVAYGGLESEESVNGKEYFFWETTYEMLDSFLETTYLTLDSI